MRAQTVSKSNYKPSTRPTHEDFVAAGLAEALGPLVEQGLARAHAR